MLTVTFLWVAFVQGAPARDLTGATAFSLAECLETPAASLPENVWTIQAAPAPYGFGSYTSGTVGVHVQAAALLAAITGRAGGDWTDLHGVVQHRWTLTSALVVGSMADLSWSGARGFASNLGLDLTLHMRYFLDPTWSVVCGLDRLLQVHTRYQPPARALRLGASWEGAAAVSGQITVTADHGASAAFGVSGALTPAIALRGTFVTQPLTAAAAVRLSDTPIPLIVVECAWVADLGLRTSVAVDLP